MQLNLGKFSYNKKCGYLLKPEAMRRIGVNQSFDSFSENTMANIVAQTATIQLINGIFMLEKRKPSYITIELYGLPVDTFKGTRVFRAKVDSTRAFNAFFSDTDTVFRFSKVNRQL
jgi:phosphatidylinositol phospholipase C beta